MEKVKEPQKAKSVAQEEKQIEAYQLPATLVDVVLKYLSARPWNEVDHIINGFRTSAKPVVKTQTNETKDQDASDA